MLSSTLTRTVLIVEDEQSLRDAQRLMLSSEGFDVLEAVNGKEGLELALSKHPDVIILDIVMPELDGMGFLKKLREDKWGAMANVILFTNGDDAKTLPDAIRLGVQNYLIKSETRLEDIAKIVKSQYSI